MHLEEFIYMMNNEGREINRDIDQALEEIIDDAKVYIRHNEQVSTNEITAHVRKYDRKFKKIIS